MLTLAKYEPGYGAFDKWKKEFGPVFTYWLGINPFVVIADYKMLKETFVKDGDAFAGKFNSPQATMKYRGGFYGVIDTEGDMQREHRRFTMHTLRDFGVGKDVMQTRVLEEVERMCNNLQQQTLFARSIGVQEAFDLSVGSIINQLLFGYAFDESNTDEFRHLKKTIKIQLKDTGNPLVYLVIMYPLLQNIPFVNGPFKRIIAYGQELFSFFRTQIKKHESEISFDNEESTDFVEAYLKEQRRRELQGDVGTFTHKQLENVCLDMWIAGMETTSNTLGWTVLYLLNHPECQEKMHEELDRVIGSIRLIRMDDRSKLPYVAAVINESQRLANLLPMNLPHRLMRDVNLCGHTVPAGTGVLAQISSVLYDERIFPEPLSFRPERFIDEAGNLKKVDELIPFSIGKRQCLGEGLARMELFLFTANIFNRFRFRPNGAPPSKEKKFGLTVTPLPFTCQLSPKYV